MATLQENIDIIQDTLDDIHDAIIAKGGTVSGTDITSYASGITNIPVPVGIQREVSAQGIYQIPTTSFTFSLPSNATNLGDYALNYAFRYCTGLTSVDLSSLTTISGSKALQQAFYGCTGLNNKSLSFPALTSSAFGSNTNQFNGMLGGNVTGCTVHFPSNLQSVIGSWSDVTVGFGGTNTTVLFDLTATS